ncbi:MAG: LuxR C-terminal-related transcriptional regulator [Muribaculaceae bacterium]|nr:LuxR C-terminal-related transcriptional regulator [Muribaculaceae bacterium]
MKIYQHKLTFQTLLTALLGVAVLLGTGCRREQRLYPFRWEAVDPLTDSLTLAIDRGLYLREDPDSLSILLSRLEKHTDKKEKLRGRTDFLRATLMLRMDSIEGAVSRYTKLLESVDSSSNPYLYNRLLFQTDSDDVSPASYNATSARLEYFRKINDPFMSGAAYIELANLLTKVKDNEGALQAYHEADSLLKASGFHELAIPIGKNVAEVLMIRGDSIEGITLLKDLLKNRYIISRPELHYNILNDYVTESRDTLGAREMIKILDSEGLPLESDCRLATFLSEVEYDRGNYREALRLARAGYHQAIEDEEDDVRAVSMHRLSEAFNALGRNDSAYHYLSREIAFVDSMNMAQQPMEIRAKETERFIQEKKMEKELKQEKKLLWVTVCVFIVFCCVMIAAGVVVWRIHALRLAKAKTRLEMEKSHRRLMATQILVEEKDALLNTLSRDLRDLEEKGEISAGTKGHIAAPIKTHIVQTSGRNSFLDTFSELHPDFVERLKAHSPELTDTDIRLAKYIAVGLDNKQIASTLGIRPESVKQARWRLRSKLHLSSGASLEDYLANFVE